MPVDKHSFRQCTGFVAFLFCVGALLPVSHGLAAGDGFLVTYSDGTNSYLATVESTAGIADDAIAAAGDLVATNVTTFTGISDVDTILAAQFADIIA